MVKWPAGIVLLVSAAAAACSSDEVMPRIGCAGVGPGEIPGVVVQGPGIDLQVRDPFGRGQAVGTSATVHRSDGTVVVANVQDTLNILAAYNITGTFTATLTRPYYQDATVTNITVTTIAPNACSVNTAKVPVTLQLAPGAPPLRALTILGAAFLDHAGAQAKLQAHFDADPGVSTAVTWAVNDATLASVDANGVVTAKCTRAGGTATVTATSVVDASITSSVSLGVAPASSCP
jgi:hypothetical protein